MQYDEIDSNNIYIKLNELYSFRSDCLDAKIENINFKSRVKNCLIKNEITTLKVLLNMNLFEISKLRGAGKNACDNILFELDKLNFIYNRLNGPKYMSEAIDLFCELVNDNFSQIERFFLKQRTKGATLEEAGKKQNLTRQRVNQIEERYVMKFGHFDSCVNFLHKIDFLNKKSIVTETDAISFMKDNEMGKELFYLLKTLYKEKYDKKIRALCLNKKVDIDAGDILKYKLPMVFANSEKEKIIMEFSDIEKGINSSYVEEVLNNNWNCNQRVYVNKMANLSDKYTYIIKKYFPVGMHIDSAIEEFKKIYVALYDEEIENDNKRAISSVIERNCVLCDRGKYKYLSKKILKKKILIK